LTSQRSKLTGGPAEAPPGAPGKPPLRRFLLALGPAIIVASVVLGPGSILTSSRVGTEYGYQMLWVLAGITILLIGMVALAGRLGVSLRGTMCDELAARLGRPVAIAVGLIVFLIIASFQTSTTSSKTTGEIPVYLTWSATDSAGVSRYELQQSTNGGSYTPVPINTTGTAKTVSLTPGDSYQFRVQAKDGAGNWSEWAYGPEFVVNAHQETDGAITYDGTWTQQALDSAYGGGASYAEVQGDRATFSLVGRTFACVATKDADRGKAEVWVDGVKVKTADLYASTPQPRKVMFAESWSTSDSHTIEVRVLGTKNASSAGTRVDVDAFIVLGPDGSAP
jgi:hypothetical protein